MDLNNTMLVQVFSCKPPFNDPEVADVITCFHADVLSYPVEQDDIQMLFADPTTLRRLADLHQDEFDAGTDDNLQEDVTFCLTTGLRLHAGMLEVWYASNRSEPMPRWGDA